MLTCISCDSPLPTDARFCPRCAAPVTVASPSGVDHWLDFAVAPPPATNWWGLTTTSARLDSLGALRRYDEIEREAPALLRPQTYLEPFALRALGQARGDRALLGRAATGFARLGLAAQVARTEQLLAGAQS